MVGMDHVTFQVFMAALTPHLQLVQDLAHQHQSLLPGVTLVRIANTHVTTLEEAQSLHIKSRRIWVGITDPTASLTARLWMRCQYGLNCWSQHLSHCLCCQ
jgi:hypothetical protein